MTRLLKDSGIPWINQIPQNREVKKVKYTLLSRNENNNPIRSRDILSLTAKQGVIPLDEKEWWWNKPKEDYSAYKLAYPWDIVINSMNILSWSVWLSNYFWCVSPVYYMLRPSKANDDVRFFNYIFQTKVFQLSLLWLWNWILIKESDSWKFNTIRMRIPLDKFWNLYIPIPSSEEQKKISNYLEKKIWEIDSLYADIEKQIEKLEEYKLSIITEAVTKWLNSNIELKHSWNNLIWDIQSNYITIRLKHVCKKITDGSHFSPTTTAEWKKYITATNVIHDTVEVNNAKNISEYDFKILVRNWCQPKKGDILLTKDWSVWRTAVVDNTDYVVLSSVWILTPNPKRILPRFLKYAIDSKNVQEQMFQSMAGSALKRITISKINEYYIVLPSLDEQLEILSFLDKKCAEISIIIDKKQEQLNILEQYKKSLIYEYVTGKKEVPSNY